MAGISIRSVSKSFGEVRVLNSLSLDIEDGQFVTLLGPSGCGKTTLLRVICGLEVPDSGEVEIAGRPVNHLPAQARGVAMVFQSYALFPHLSVARNIALPLRLRRLTRLQRLLGRFFPGARAREVMREIDREVDRIADNLQIRALLQRKPAQLSGGQRQRVALGRAMIRAPGVLLLDEPLSSLDSQLRVEMRSELTELQRRLGSTFVLVTHDQTEAMTMSDRIAVVLGGRVEQYSRPEALYADPASLAVARFVGTPGINELEARIHGSGRLALSGRQEIVLSARPLSESGNVTLGVRPEGLTFVRGEMPGSIPVTVRSVEHLGSESLLHVQRRDADSSLVVRLATDAGPVPRRGETGYVLIDETRILVFDESGARVRMPAASVPRVLAHA